jgi:hypothetical protein
MPVSLQMALASIPQWLEFVLNKKYPKWREVERNEDGSARYMPAGVRVLEKSLLREYTADEVVACFPDDLDKFIGPNTRVVAVSTHNPLGVTFAAGVYTSIYGSSKEPLNSIYSRLMFDKIKSSPYRKNFQVLVGRAAGRSPKAMLSRIWAWTAWRKAAASPLTLWRCFGRRLREKSCRGKSTWLTRLRATPSCFPTSGRHSGQWR